MMFKRKKPADELGDPGSKAKLRLERRLLKKNKSAGFISWTCTIFALLIWSAGLGLISLYYAAGDYGIELFNSYFENHSLWVYNMLPVFMLVALLFFVTNRAYLAMLLSGALVLSLSAVNYLKLVLRSDPLIASDIRYIGEAANIGVSYDMDLPNEMIFIIGAAILLIVPAFFLLRGRFTGRYSAQRRMLGLFLTAVACVALVTEIYKDEQLYIETLNIEVKLQDREMSRWSGTDLYVSRGFIYPLIYSGLTFSETRPEGYVKAVAEQELADYGYDDIPEDKKVSVISVMLEAFTDLSEIYDIPEETSPYAFWHELQAESVYGNLIPNVFAGNTIDTERGFLTGMTERYDYRKPTGSYVRYFADQGYFTEFCHPGLDWFYNRNNVMDYIGFQNSFFMQNRYEPVIEDWPINDYLFFPDLIQLFERSIKNGYPYFNFSVTYQNHGPYSEETLYAGYEIVPNRDFSKGSYNILNNYLWGIRESCVVLEEFVDYFRTSEEPVILVLFGDHKPWLGDNNGVYLELDMDMFQDNDDGFYNYFSTPYIIWANDKAKETLGREFKGYAGDMSPCFLMPELFSQASWKGDEFMKAAQNLKETIDIVHGEGNRRENGEIVAVVSDQGRETLLKFKDLQYYRKYEQISATH